VLEEAYAAGQWRLGESDPLMLEISYDLGVVAEELGNRHEARKALGRVVEVGQPVLGDLHWAVLKARAYLDGDTSVLRPGAPTPPSPTPPIQLGPESGWSAPEIHQTAPPMPPGPENGWPAQQTAPPGPGNGWPAQQTPPQMQPGPRSGWPAEQAAPPGPESGWPAQPQQTAPPSPDNGWPGQQQAAPPGPEGGWPAPEEQQHQPTTYIQTPAPPVQQATYVQQAPPNNQRPALPDQRLAPQPYQPAQQAPPQTQQPGPYDQQPYDQVVRLPDDQTMLVHPPAEQRIPMQPTYHDRIPAHVEPAAEKHGNSYQKRGPALFAAIAAILAATIAVVALVFVLANGNGGGNDNEPDVPTLGGGPAPTDLRVNDRGNSVEITWTDAGEGKNSTIITGGHPGEVLKPMGEVGPGETAFELRGLNDQLDYCFAVVAVYGTNSFATSAQSCTTRPGPASTG
jgi:hypothetical protein